MKDLLLYAKMPKATYMYWQKRFDRVNPDKKIEEKILEIRKNNKDYGYRRIYGALRNLGYIINKKKVQRIIQKLGLQVTSFTRKSRKYNSYKGEIGKQLKIELEDDLILIFHIKKLLQIQLNLNIMK